MTHYALKPELVLAQSGTDDPQEFIRLGIEAARKDDFERGLIFLAEAHKRLVDKDTVKDSTFPPAAFSYYGLCLGLYKGRIKEAADFCQIALDLEFYNAENYANLARVWIAGRVRRKAIETLERGLAVDPRSTVLVKIRRNLGVRKKPVLPFLGRDNPLNVTLGRIRDKKEPGKTSAKTNTRAS